MSRRRYILAPEAALDLVQIWRYVKKNNVRFFAVYEYLIVYRPDTKPVQVVSILHGHRDVEQILRDRI